MKHRALSILLALTFLLSVFMFCTTAFAATGAQDGVSAELTTDKAEYAAGEVMNVTLVVKNGNARVNNVRTELVIPAGVTLTTGALVSDGVDMAPGAEATYNYGLTVNEVEVPTTTPAGGDGSPETGDISLMIYGVLAIVSLTGLVVLMGGKNIFKQRWFALVLCGAVLLGVIGPVAASAATTEKTFEVTETVTIAGNAAEVKAIITYDLNDDVVHTEEVAFKKDGQYLWNVDVEQGYYLPSDISYNGQTTSKDGTYRPEVNAPYIDMLFGTAKKTGEFTTNIFNDAAQQTVLMGLTDDPASKAALELIDEDEWIITVIDGKLVVTGWYDNATAAAARALYALGSADAADITLSLPMIGKMDYVNVDLPAVTFGNFRGGMDSDFGAVVLRWNEVVADDFDTYCAALEAAGYTLRESNTMAGYKNTKTLEFATYVKGDDAVLVQYLPVSLLDQDPATLNAVELKAYEAAYSADGDAIRLILTSTDLLGNTAEENTGWTDLGITPKMHNVNLYNKQGDGNDIGQAEIFTLADGSYIVVDGGQGADAEQLYRTLYYMNERPDGKIVIAAWFLTHAHADHTGALGSLAASEWASEITIEQVILNPVAKSYRFRTQYDPYGYAAGFSVEFDNIKTVTAKFAQGEDYQLVLPHMGQIMYIRNAEVEMLTVGDEDMFPVIFNNDNAQSLAFRVTFPGVTIDGEDQSVMILGDSALDQTYNVYFPLMCGELYADIIQVSHHGLGGQTSRFYPMFSGIDVSIFPTTWRTINTHGLIYSSGTNKGLQPENGGTTKLNIVCDEYVQTLELPFDVENDHVLRTKIGTYKTKFQDGEMTLASLGVGRFGNDVNKYLEATVDYLLGENADADVLVLNSVRYLQADGVNVVEALAEAMDYPYYYYAPAWNQIEGADLTVSNDGTYGNLILSRYPILSAENLVYHEGTTADASNEGRSAGHVILDVEGKNVDVYFTEVTGSNNWTELAEVFQPENDVWFIMGVGKNSVSSIQTALGDETVHAAVADHTRENIYSNGMVTFTANSKQSVNAATGCANMDALITATASFSLYTAPESTTAPLRQAFVSWWAHSWGGSYDNFEIIAQNLKDYNPGLVAFQQISNSTIGITPEQILAETGYEYGHYVEVLTTSAGKTIGHMALSHYPIEILDNLIISDGSDDQYNEQRAFGHIVVTINGTEIDLWYGGMDGSANQLAKLEAAVNEVAAETGRPFIISTNDCNGMVGLTSFAGYGVYSYSTPYMANVLVSTGKVTVTKAEAIKTSISYPTFAGMDDMNMLDLDVEMAPAILNWWAGNWGGSNDKFETIMEDVRTQNIPIVTFQQINNKLIGATAEQVAKESGYEYFHYVDCYAKPDGTFNGHMILSHYPIEVLDTIVLREIGSTEGESRTFGHVIVDINGTKTDVYFGATDWLSADHMKALEGYVAEFASEFGRPFIVSANDMPSQDVTSYAGVEVYNYRTDYVSAVLISKGALEVTKAETIPSAASGGAIDKMNIIRFETTNGGLTPGDPYEPPVTPDPEPEPEVPVGEQLTIKVANLPAFRFGGKYNDNKATIDAILAGYDADILGVTLVDQNSTRYNKTDVPAQLAEALGYEYYYYAPVWTCDTDGNGGTVGHMIFSKYEIVFSETIQLTDGSDPAVEGRGAAHIVVALNETTTLDVYATGFENSGNWTAFAEKFNNQGDYFLIMGNTKVTSAAEVETALGVTGVTASRSHNRAHYASAGAAFSNAGTDNAVNQQTGIANPDECHYADLTLTLNKVEEEEPADDLTLTLGAWNVNGTSVSDNLTAVKGWLEENKPDIMGLVSFWQKNGDVEIDVDALAEELGYKYAYYAKKEDGGTVERGCVILSMYEMTFVKTDSYVNYYTAELNGKTYDVFTFFDLNVDDTSGSNTVVEKINQETGNEFIVFGHRLDSGITNYAGKNVTQAVGSRSSVLVSEGIAASNVKNNIAKPSGTTAHIDNIATLDATFEKAEEPVKTTYNVVSWWCSWEARWNDGTNRANAIAMMAQQDIDMLVLSNVNLNDGTGTVAGEAAAFGFEYYDFVPFTSADPNLGTILLSKYPFTFVEEFTAINNFKLVQYELNGNTIDFYFGGFSDTSVDYGELAAKVKAQQEATKNPFIVAMKGAPQNLASKLTGLTDADGNEVTTFAAFWGTANGVLVSSPMTASEVPINPTANGFPNTNGMGDRAILAPVIFP